MSEETPIYLASVAHGHVLARSPNGQPSGVVAQNRGDQDKPQKWIVERGEEENVIALRNLSNDEYLHADGGRNWSTVGTGSKQFWKISNNNVTAPGACSLSPVEYPGVFLNHFQGIRVAKTQSMKVHMWQWEQPNEFCLTWYFAPADGTFGPSTSTSNAVAEAEGNKTETSTSNATTEAEDSKTETDAKIQELEAKLARQSLELDEQKAKVKQYRKKQKAQKKESAKALPQGEKNVSVPATNGVAKEVTADERDGCKHVVLPPPRKIRRKVVGIVYKE